MRGSKQGDLWVSGSVLLCKRGWELTRMLQRMLRAQRAAGWGRMERGFLGLPAGNRGCVMEQGRARWDQALSISVTLRIWLCSNLRMRSSILALRRCLLGRVVWKWATWSTLRSTQILNAVGKETEEEKKLKTKKEVAENFFLCTADGKVLLQRCSWTRHSHSAELKLSCCHPHSQQKISSFPTPATDRKYELNFGLCFP